MPPPAPLRPVPRLIAGAALVLVMAVGAATSEPRGSGLKPWFTMEQSRLGRTNFIAHCAACHGGTMFTTFQGYSTVEKFYNKISGSMPKHAPASLPEEDYLSIVAFFLWASGFKPGTEELTAERPHLRQIIPAEGR